MLGVAMMLIVVAVGGLTTSTAGDTSEEENVQSALDERSCDIARMKCAYRSGCGAALQQYVAGCSTILHESPPDECPEACEHALIALMSSDEGKALMTCECRDEACRETKERVEVCRPRVMNAVRNDTIVSCTIGQYICAADSECSTAFEYYRRYCKSMFKGIKCSYRCRNSIAILMKREKAAKLTKCRCTGTEDYNCRQIKTNMARLCFNEEPPSEENIDENIINVIPTKNRDDFFADINSNEISPNAATKIVLKFSTFFVVNFVFAFINYFGI